MILTWGRVFFRLISKQAKNLICFLLSKTNGYIEKRNMQKQTKPYIGVGSLPAT